MFDWAPLAEAGSWAVLVAMGGAIGIGFVRGWIVAKPIYEREVTRSDRLDGQLDELTAAFKQLTEEIRRERDRPTLPGARRG